MQIMVSGGVERAALGVMASLYFGLFTQIRVTLAQEGDLEP